MQYKSFKDVDSDVLIYDAFEYDIGKILYMISDGNDQRVDVDRLDTTEFSF